MFPAAAHGGARRGGEPAHRAAQETPGLAMQLQWSCMAQARACMCTLGGHLPDQ